MSTDTTFFTNEPGAALLDRFKKTLQTTQYFDVLVGYFRISGFHRLYDALEEIEKIRILVGLNVDRKAYEVIEDARSSGELDFESHSNTKRSSPRLRSPRWTTRKTPTTSKRGSRSFWSS